MSISVGSSAFGVNDADQTTFGYPLKTHKVAAPFTNSATQYSAGHRGVDFEAKAGTSVYAIGDGQVIFAGQVAGKLYVTISHGKDFKSTYSILSTKTVRAGDQVKRGQLIGTATGTTSAKATNSFMLTLRFKDKYVDPLIYIKGEIQVREIHLGAIKKESKSYLQKIIDNEKKSIELFIKTGKSMFENTATLNSDTQSFIRWLVDKGVEGLEYSAQKANEAYQNADEYLDEMILLAKKILEDQAKGLVDDVKQGIKILKEMEKRAIKLIKQYIELSKKYSELYLKYFNKALSYGIDAARWFLENYPNPSIITLKLGQDLLLGIYDYSLTTVYTGFKILDSYFDVNWEALIRETALPISCITGQCVAPVKLACRPNAKFDIRTRSDGYKGSGNGVMFVSGINSSGWQDVLDEDTGNGDRVGQPVNFPWKTLGYDRDDVSYYSYTGVGKKFGKEDPFQDINISAKNMDDEIKQWKKDNPGKKLDLIAHSLGGTVTSLWLAKYYEPNEKSYPELGKVILYAAPLSGTSLASAGAYIDQEPISQNLHDKANEIAGSQFVPPVDSESMKQVKEDGDVEQILRGTKALKKVEVHTIRASSDLIVSAGSQPIDGANELVLDINKSYTTISSMPSISYGYDELKSHSLIVNSEMSTSAAQYILQGKKLPCVRLSNAGRSMVKAPVVHAVEMTLGRAVRDIATGANTGISNEHLDAISN